MNAKIQQVVEEGPEVLRNYLRAVYWLWMAADPLKGRKLDPDNLHHGAPGSQVPTRPIAGGRLDQEVSWMKRQTDSIESYLDDPEFVGSPNVAKRRCAHCRKGMARGWLYCPMCGVDTLKT